MFLYSDNSHIFPLWKKKSEKLVLITSFSFKLNDIAMSAMWPVGLLFNF